jgi:16S rRNA (guanine527-N7)-methyltransferase
LARGRQLRAFREDIANDVPSGFAATKPYTRHCAAVSPPIEPLGPLLSRYHVSSEAAEPLEILLELLAQPQAPTSVHDPERGIYVHIADSLAGLAVAELRAARLIADLGAGAGLPGLVLAASLPKAHVILVEAASRKSDFLRSAIAAMGLTNAEVVWSRVEEWSDGLERCDAVCTRALAALPVICEYAAPLLREDGVLVAWKGAVSALEAVDAEAAAAHLGLEADPVLPVMPFPGSGRRTLHVLHKVAPTPTKYPRRPGIATKRPLSARTLR